MTHIDNIPHIVRCGIVRGDSLNHNVSYVNIGDKSIINSRANRTVQGYKLDEYIPFYLGPRSPMLYVIQHGYNQVAKVEPKNIVYCVIRLDDLIKNNVDCVFTNGHALNAVTEFFPPHDLTRINELVSYEDVYSTSWNNADVDLKRRKEAELLIHQDLPFTFIRGFVVYNETAQELLKSYGIAEKFIAIKPGFYF